MRRLHLIEIEDQPWCPRVLRDCATDFLQFSLNAARSYAPAAPMLRRLLSESGASRILDLCSGAGGAWPTLSQEVTGPSGAPVPICLTDAYPNLDAFARVNAVTEGQVAFRRQPVDAADVPAELLGLRTLFTSFHHFRPDAARALLEDAVRRRQPIAVFEATQRSPAAILATLFSPLTVLLATPFIRPFRWSRLFWTYLLPLIPLLVLFDGLVSCLRTYTPAEMTEMTREFGDYHWEVGEEKGKGPLPITYLLGYPAHAGSG